jgi:hypothetical protein
MPVSTAVKRDPPHSVGWRCAFRIGAAAAAMTGLAACTVIGSYSTVDETTLTQGCRSALGSYSLPKRVVHFTISKNAGEPFHFLSALETIPVPDSQHVFCLDHLASAFSSDEIRVHKNKINVPTGASPQDAITDASTPYLQLIASKAVDHTAGIIRRIIRIAFIVLTNRPDFTPARSAVIGGAANAVVVADFKVDPFDFKEMADVNESIRKLGFCLVLEDYTFNRASADGTIADKYCRTPREVAHQHPPPTAEAIKQLHYLIPKPVNGVFFRPRGAYRLTVYINPDPAGRYASWTPALAKNFEFENIMPIVSVGVDRALFATRRTGLVFDDGLLVNVCISKGSEVQGAIQIPLEVVYGLVALPSEMIRGAFQDVETANQLLNARKNLVAAQNAYIKFLNDPKADPSKLPTKDKKPQSLSLGNPPAAQTFGDADSGTADQTKFAPPDAGGLVIADASKADALSKICPELLAINADKGAF